MRSFLKPRNPRWSKCADTVSTHKNLRRWFQRFPGELVREQDNQVLQQVLPTIFGYHLLKIGYSEDVTALSSSKIPHRMVMDWEVPDQVGTTQQANLLSGNPEALPFSSDCLDLIILSRVLEFSSNPHQVLREVDRCLIPEGHVVIVCFNPFGLWSLWTWLLGWREKPPWCGRFIRYSRLRDWLQLLGFDVVDCHWYFYRPPLRHQASMERLRFLERIGSHWWTIFSGAYVMVAKKRVATLTPLKPRWRPRRSGIVAPGLVGSNSQVVEENSVTRDKKG